MTRDFLPNRVGHEYDGEIGQEIEGRQLLKVDEWARVADGPRVSLAHEGPSRRPRG